MRNPPRKRRIQTVEEVQRKLGFSVLYDIMVVGDVYGFLILLIRFCCQTLPEGIHAQIHLCT